MKFAVLVKLLDDLSRNNKRIFKVLILRDFLKENFDYEELGFLLDLISGNFHREIGRRSFAISLRTVFDVLSLTYGVSRVEIERRFNRVGDLAKLARELFKKTNSFRDEELSVEFVKQMFLRISKVSGTNSNKIKKEILMKLFFACENEVESFFLTKIILNDLRIGTKEAVVREAFANAVFAVVKDVNLICQCCGFVNLANDVCFSCSSKIDVKGQDLLAKGACVFEEDRDLLVREVVCVGAKDVGASRELYNRKVGVVERKYSLINSFSRVVEDFRRDRFSVFEDEIVFGFPVKSMLGVRASSVGNGVEGFDSPFFADYKYDGLRIQIQKSEKSVVLFSRNLENVTFQFPEVVEFFERNFRGESFVLDSECVGYDYEKQVFLDFQDFSRRFQSKNIDDVKHIRVVVRAFDILFYQGESLIKMSYERRREILESLFLNRDIEQDLSFSLESLRVLK